MNGKPFRLSNTANPLLSIILIVLPAWAITIVNPFTAKGRAEADIWIGFLCFAAVLIIMLIHLLLIDELQLDTTKKEFKRTRGWRLTPKIYTGPFSCISELKLKQVSQVHPSGRGGITGSNSYSIVIEFDKDIPAFSCSAGESAKKIKEEYQWLSDITGLSFKYISIYEQRRQNRNRNKR